MSVESTMAAGAMMRPSTTAVAGPSSQAERQPQTPQHALDRQQDRHGQAAVVELSERARRAAEASSSPTELTREEVEELRKLAARDREVRRHEQAHKTAAGRYATSGPHYEYEKGPDGRSYAVGGHVKIDVSPVPDDPEATIQKMRVVRQAAMAPAEPSAADRRIAARAASHMAKAQQEKMAEAEDA
jgi:hypothetical protein